MTARQPLFVALGQQRYQVDRPWGDLPAGAGKVTDVVCDDRGHVFVLLRADSYVDPVQPTVIELAPDGRRVAAWGEDIADGHMLSIGPDFRIYVVDRDAHEIVVFDRTGRRVGGIGQRNQPNAPFNHPCDVATAPSGDIYVADGYGASRVHRFNPNGDDLIATWGEPGDAPGHFTTPHGIWALADGRVAVTDRENNRLQVFSATGDLLAIWPDFYHPMDIFQDAAGRIYVTDQIPRLTMLSPDGTVLGRCRPVLNGAHCMWGDHAGNLYMAEMNPSRVTRLTPVA
jgi:DNA-binding beta-propeller fold protein YncE